MKDLFMFMIPIVVAAVLVPLYDKIKKGVSLLDGLPAPVTQIIVGVSAWLFTKAVAAGIALTGADLTTLTQGDVGALASAGLAYVFKLSQKKTA
jgi:hypothetical protein